MPVLNELNPSFSSVFSGCLSVLRDSEAYLQKVTDEQYSRIENHKTFSVRDIIALDKVIRDRLIIKICESFGGKDIGFKHVDIINSFLEKGGAVMLHGGITVASDGEQLYRATAKLPDVEIFEPIIKDKTEYCFISCKLTLASVDKSEISNYNIKKLSAMGYADGDKLKNAVFRSRNNGDRFRFPYAQHSKSLKNLYKEKNITPEARYGIPMLADGENILWLCGVGVSDYAKVTDDTKKIVKISISDL